MSNPAEMQRTERRGLFLGGGCGVNRGRWLHVPRPPQGTSLGVAATWSTTELTGSDASKARPPWVIPLPHEPHSRPRDRRVLAPAKPPLPRRRRRSHPAAGVQPREGPGPLPRRIRVGEASARSRPGGRSRPASTSTTRRSPRALSRPASTLPAEPPPTIRISASIFSPPRHFARHSLTRMAARLEKGCGALHAEARRPRIPISLRERASDLE